MPDEHTVKACPECDTSAINYRVRTSDHRCTECGHVFDEPEERPPKKNQKASRNPEHPATKLERRASEGE